jgi:hypothetical protein
VAELGERVEPQRPGVAFERVRDPEDPLERRAVVRALLELDQRCLELVEVFRRLGDER